MRRSRSRPAGRSPTRPGQRLTAEGTVDDLLLIDPDQSSNDPEVVSVLATEARVDGFGQGRDGGVLLDPHRPPRAGPPLGTGTDCSADEASVAEPGRWPEP